MVFCPGTKLQDVLEMWTDVTLLDHHRPNLERTYCLLCEAIHTLHESFPRV